MKLTVQSEQIGYDLVQQMLNDLSHFLRMHILAQGNCLDLELSKPSVGENGVYTLNFSLEWSVVPTKKFVGG